MGKRQYGDDDGRTIADMSNVERPSLASAWISRRGANELEHYRGTRRGAVRMPSSADTGGISGKERRAAIYGALGASLLIGMIFLVAFAALILLLSFFWGVL